MTHQGREMMKQNYFEIPDTDNTRQLAWTEWGDVSLPPVVCLHGLTRNSRDFDFLARAMSEHYRVICPDMAGRGKSGWLEDTSTYDYPTYVGDTLALISSLGYETVTVVGTSMGGIIGMSMASLPNSPVGRLIINDIGIFIPKEALQRIISYMCAPLPKFASLEEVDRYLRFIHMPFGPLTDEQWNHLAIHSSSRKEDGSFDLHYDPSIADPMRPNNDKPVEDVNLTEIWQEITCPVLTLRGHDSDLFLSKTAEQMTITGPGCELVTFDGIGHAPMLMDNHQIEIVLNWMNDK